VILWHLLCQCVKWHVQKNSQWCFSIFIEHLLIILSDYTESHHKVHKSLFILCLMAFFLPCSLASSHLHHCPWSQKPN
jgi:hypothetical protein